MAISCCFNVCKFRPRASSSSPRTSRALGNISAFLFLGMVLDRFGKKGEELAELLVSKSQRLQRRHVLLDFPVLLDRLGYEVPERPSPL